MADQRFAFRVIVNIVIRYAQRGFTVAVKGGRLPNRRWVGIFYTDAQDSPALREAVCPGVC